MARQRARSVPPRPTRVPDCRIVENGVELSRRDRAAIEKEARKLATFFDRVLEVRVVVSCPHRRLHGEPVDYAVRLHLAVPRGEVVVRRRRGPDLLTAAQAAFKAAGRLVQDHVRRLRGPPAVVVGSPVGRVTRLFPFEGYGFLAGEDGTELYFHRNAVREAAFEALEVGDRVRYVEEPGEKGPQASTVTRAGPLRRRRARAPTRAAAASRGPPRP